MNIPSPFYYIESRSCENFQNFFFTLLRQEKRKREKSEEEVNFVEYFFVWGSVVII